MLNKAKEQLKIKIGDDPLVENLFKSFQGIAEEFVAQKPVDLLQKTGPFVESALRIAEHLVLGHHTPLSGKFNIDSSIKTLESATGLDGLRIHLPRLTRAIYDFRTRKNSAHLKAIDPVAIDASVVFNVSNWVLIEILKESGLHDAENAIRVLFTIKIPLIQRVGGILRTTNPALTGPQRLLLLLYAEPDGMTEERLLSGTKNIIKDTNHLKTNLRALDQKDCVHYTGDKWVLFGKGFIEAENIIKKYS